MEQDLYDFLMDLQVTAANSGGAAIQKIDAYLLRNPLAVAPDPFVEEPAAAPVAATHAKPAAKK